MFFGGTTQLQSATRLVWRFQLNVCEEITSPANCAVLALIVYGGSYFTGLFVHYHYLHGVLAAPARVAGGRVVRDRGRVDRDPEQVVVALQRPQHPALISRHFAPLFRYTVRVLEQVI